MLLGGSLTFWRDNGYCVIDRVHSYTGIHSRSILGSRRSSRHTSWLDLRTAYFRKTCPWSGSFAGNIGGFVLSWLLALQRNPATRPHQPNQGTRPPQRTGTTTHITELDSPPTPPKSILDQA